MMNQKVQVYMQEVKWSRRWDGDRHVKVMAGRCRSVGGTQQMGGNYYLGFWELCDIWLELNSLKQIKVTVGGDEM